MATTGPQIAEALMLPFREQKHSSGVKLPLNVLITVEKVTDAQVKWGTSKCAAILLSNKMTVPLPLMQSWVVNNGTDLVKNPGSKLQCVLVEGNQLDDVLEARTVKGAMVILPYQIKAQSYLPKGMRRDAAGDTMKSNLMEPTVLEKFGLTGRGSTFDEVYGGFEFVPCVFKFSKRTPAVFGTWDTHIIEPPIFEL
jgi:hypothetical protein